MRKKKKKEKRRESLNPPLFGYRLRYYLRPAHMFDPLRDLFWHVRYYVQRARRGWAISDTWNGDVYLARLISEMCAYLKEHTYGTPYPFYEDEEHGHEHYEAYLGEMAQAFGDYVAYMEKDCFDTLDVGNVRYTAILERMRPLMDHWSCLND